MDITDKKINNMESLTEQLFKKVSHKVEEKRKCTNKSIRSYKVTIITKLGNMGHYPNLEKNKNLEILHMYLTYMYTYCIS